MLFFGAFVARYRIELILSFPLVALVMAVYFLLSFEKDSPVQNPERLHSEPRLMVPVIVCAVMMGVLSFVRIPQFTNLFTPSSFSAPQGSAR